MSFHDGGRRGASEVHSSSEDFNFSFSIGICENHKEMWVGDEETIPIFLSSLKPKSRNLRAVMYEWMSRAKTS